MKALVTYFSQTGNTEKIAKGIAEEVSQAYETEIKKLEDVDAVEEYDCVFIGSPLHSGDLAQPVKEFLSGRKWRAGQKIAGFITHFAPGYPQQDMDIFTKSIQATCDDNKMEYLGAFDCQGYLADAMHQPVKEMIKASDEQWAGMVDQMTGRPNAEDVAQAKAFAKSLI